MSDLRIDLSLFVLLRLRRCIIEFGTPEFYKLVDRLVQEGRQGILALSGEMLLVIDGKTVLIKAPK